MDKKSIREMADACFRAGLSREKIFYYMKSCGTKVDDAELSVMLEDIVSHNKRNIAQVVDVFVSMSTDPFTLRDVYDECKISNEERGSVRMALLRLAQNGTLEQDEKRGKYRLKNHEVDIIDWQSADVGNTWDILLPFKLHELAYFYPQNVIVFAGEKNCGKTAIANAIIRRNMDKYKIRLLNSEAAEEEIKARRLAHPDLNVEDWKDEVVKCNIDHYDDKILKDHINIVDYLEVKDGEFYKVADQIRKIYEAIGRGLAIIFIQKAKGAEFGRGKEFSAEKARLVCNLTMGNPRTCFVQMVKNAKVNPNPSGLKIFYKIINDGSQLVEISREQFGISTISTKQDIQKYNQEVKSGSA
jgi:hypothetical protein